MAKRRPEHDEMGVEDGKVTDEGSKPPTRDEALAAASHAVRGLAMKSQEEAIQVLRQQREGDLNQLLSWSLGQDSAAVGPLPCSASHTVVMPAHCAGFK